MFSGFTDNYTNNVPVPKLLEILISINAGNKKIHLHN